MPKGSLAEARRLRRGLIVSSRPRMSELPRVEFDIERQQSCGCELAAESLNGLESRFPLPVVEVNGRQHKQPGGSRGKSVVTAFVEIGQIHRLFWPGRTLRGA